LRASLILSALALSASAADFARDLYPVFEAAGCRGCHTQEGVASTTRLRFPETGAAPDRINAFGQSLVSLVEPANPAQSLLLQKPTNRVRHAGGQRIKPDSPEEANLRAWITQLSTLTPAEVAKAKEFRSDAPAGLAKRPSVALRRLTNSQYNNTVRDLLNERSMPATQFPQEDFVNGFRNQYESQNLSPILLDAYAGAAARLTAAAFRNGLPQHLVSCKPSVACRDTFIRTFGQRAFRRPLDGVEFARYSKLAARQPNFSEGVRIVLEAMLQSPAFLFRLDAAPEPSLKSWATASRLSYALWDSMPDAELFAAAASGELNAPAGVQKQGQRMLRDPKAHEALDDFVSQWLRFDRNLSATKDRNRFREFSADTLFAMTQEARHFISDLVWNNKNFMEIFTGEFSYPNGGLAKIYGIPAPPNDYDRVAFPPTSERSGLLGQALFLSLTSKPDETAPTARGLFVREQFLCQHVPDPPPGVNTNLPEATPERPMTNRDRLGEHTRNETCARCHSLIDPIGFGFEKFDAIGQRREKLELNFIEGEGEKRKPSTKKIQIDLDTSAKVEGIPNGNFNSPVELGKILAGNEVCQQCVVLQYFRYVSGRMETVADRPLIRRVFEDFRTSGFRFQNLIMSMMVANAEPNN
jgi:hypothetical protein